MNMVANNKMQMDLSHSKSIIVSIVSNGQQQYVMST